MAQGQTPDRSVRSLWGSIQRGVEARETTADLWARIRDELGLPDTGPTGIARATFNQLRHDAALGRNAQAAYMRDLERSTARGMDLSLDARHIAQAPWSRTQAEQNTVPIHQVNFEMTMVDENGNEDSGWFTTVFRGDLPPTVQALADQVSFDAEMMAGRYGKSLVATGAIRILAV